MSIMYSPLITIDGLEYTEITEQAIENIAPGQYIILKE